MIIQLRKLGISFQTKDLFIHQIKKKKPHKKHHTRRKISPNPMNVIWIWSVLVRGP